MPSSDAKDAAHFQSMRKRGLVRAIELDFANPSSEHRLWVPDQVLGAYSETIARLDRTAPWQEEWQALSKSVITVRIQP